MESTREDSETENFQSFVPVDGDCESVTCSPDLLSMSRTTKEYHCRTREALIIHNPSERTSSPAGFSRAPIISRPFPATAESYIAAASYHPRLQYYLHRILPRADDMLQEVWLAVFRALPRLADPSALAAWLYRIARDKASVQWRRRPPEHPLNDSNPVKEPSRDNEFRKEDAQEIHARLDLLTPEQREILVLRFLEDMTYEQIAKVIGCLIGTVQSRLYYAKSTLRQVIEHRRST